jgi:hypothetical protein
MPTVSDDHIDQDERKPILRYCEKLTVPVVARDGCMPVVDCGIGDAHRPGFRSLADVGAATRIEESYDAYLERLHAAWKSPAQVAADAERSERACTDAMTDADPRQVAYERYCRALVDAWRRA